MCYIKFNFLFSLYVTIDLTGLCGVEILDTNDDEVEEEGVDNDADADPSDAGSFVPVAAHSLSETDTIKKAV